MAFAGILGHEFLATDPQGRRVTAEINFACRECHECRSGNPEHCPSRSVLGILNHDGAMAERVCVPCTSIHAIPDEVDDLRAVFIEPLAAAFRLIEQVEVTPDMRLAVLGDGKLGILCAWVLRLTGAEVHLIGKHPDKLMLAGPEIHTHELDALAELGREFDLVIDATGSPSGFPIAIRLVRPRGTVVLKTTVASVYEINLAPLVVDEIRVIGSRCGPFPRAIDALAKGEIDPTPLIGAIFALDRAEEAFAAAEQPGARKILIRV
jgi:threonine dehydrogenase-like Zn-dependent dehydrogenase